MAESTSDSTSEVARATPPPSSDAVSNADNSDTVSLPLVGLVHVIRCINRLGLKRNGNLTHLRHYHVPSCQHQQLLRKGPHLRS